MSNLFSIDNRTLAKLDKFASQFPKDFQYAAASVMSSQAFEARQSIIDTIDDQMEVRSPAFIKRQVRFDKADPRSPISRQFSVAGSVRTKGFSGWVEQQTGKAPEKEQAITGAGRGGDFGNKLPNAFQLRRGRIFKRASDYKTKYAKTKSQQTVAMIKAAKAGKQTKPFIIERGLSGPMNKLKYGLYSINRGKLMRLQNFEEPFNVRRVDWMGLSLDRLDRKFNLDKAWSKQLDYRLKRKQKR